MGIDAPKSKQLCSCGGEAWACGRAAAEQLAAAVAGQSVHCVATSTDRYGRDVALCDAPGAGDLGAKLVRDGWALAYRQYGGRLYDKDEASAKAAQRGVWARGCSLQPPWEWRAEQREEQRAAREERVAARPL